MFPKIPNKEALESLILQRSELLTRVEELEAWKRSALETMNELDLQAIAKELGMPLGVAIGPRILPGIKALRNRELFLLSRMKKDAFGDHPDVWEPISWTDDLEVAWKWRDGSHMYEHKDFTRLKKQEGP